MYTLSLRAISRSIPNSISRSVNTQVSQSENYRSGTHSYQHFVFVSCQSNQRVDVRYVGYKEMSRIPLVATVGRWGRPTLVAIQSLGSS